MDQKMTRVWTSLRCSLLQALTIWSVCSIFKLPFPTSKHSNERPHLNCKRLMQPKVAALTLQEANHHNLIIFSLHFQRSVALSYTSAVWSGGHSRRSSFTLFSRQQALHTWSVYGSADRNSTVDLRRVICLVFSAGGGTRGDLLTFDSSREPLLQVRGGAYLHPICEAYASRSNTCCLTLKRSPLPTCVPLIGVCTNYYY